jgi:phosphoribosylanthranilate isomerase
MIVKVCGITRLGDALDAAAHGATALGFVFWPGSPRSITAEDARDIIRMLPASVTPVGVFVNQSVGEITRIATTARLGAIQLHGDEDPAYAVALPWPVWRAVGLSNAGAARAVDGWPAGTTFLLDAHDPVRRGGTGHTIDWDAAASLARFTRVVLAGGLTADNVGQAIATVRPWGVDVSSGVETAPGVKDLDKMTRFLAHARAAFNGR